MPVGERRGRRRRPRAAPARRGSGGCTRTRCAGMRSSLDSSSRTPPVEDGGVVREAARGEHPLDDVDAPTPRGAGDRPRRTRPRPRLGGFAVAVLGQGRRVGPVLAEVLGLAGIGDLEPLAGEQRRPQCRRVAGVDAGAGSEMDLGRATVEAGDTVRPQPRQDVRVVAVAQERLRIGAGPASASRCGTTVIWSSPPIVARTARIPGSRERRVQVGCPSPGPRHRPCESSGTPRAPGRSPR